MFVGNSEKKRKKQEIRFDPDGVLPVWECQSAKSTKSREIDIAQEAKISYILAHY
jgi:hypothetical protein